MKDTSPTEHIDPTKFEMEHEYCCGTTCDKFKVESQFKQLQDKLAAIQEVVDGHDKTNLEYYRREGIATTGYSVQVIGKIAEILTKS